MSLPLLVRATVRETASASRVIGALYGWNVLGASAGALAAPWLLVRLFGMEDAVRLGGLANLLAAAAALLVGWRAARGAVPSVEPGPAAPVRSGSAHPLRLWLLLYGLSGFIALSLEIAWFRLMDVAVKSTAYTFGTVIALYRLGLGAGSLVGGRRAERLEHPLEAFLDLQLLLLVSAGAALSLLARLPPQTPLYDRLFDYWRHEAFFHLSADWSPSLLATLHALLPLALFGLPTVLMGLSFGALQRAVQDDARTSGRKVGLLQAANILGCTAGSLVCGLFLLERIGTAGSFFLLIALGGSVFLLARARARRVRAARWRGRRRSPSCCWRCPRTTRCGRGCTASRPTAPPSFIAEDASAMSAIFPGEGSRWRVSVNGLPHSWLPYEGIHTLLGAVPALIHPRPEEVAVIGLGSGETAWAIACRPGTRSVRGFEIAAGQKVLLRRVTELAPFPSLVELWRDPRRYDLVEVDALYLTSAGSGNLYSMEFFELCARRLKPGGLVCSQKPNRRVGLTFAEALPHVVDFGNMVVGSNQEIPLDTAAWLARLRDPEVARRFDTGTLAGIAERLDSAAPGDRNPKARVGFDRDLFPRDEFGTPVGW
jgi:hypothetical protein